MSNTSLLGSYGDNSGAGLMFRNRIINGDMRIDQRLAGTKSTTVTGAYIYGLDRFATYVATGGSSSMQRQSLASSDLPYSQDGLRYFLRHNRESVVGTVNDTHFVAQQIEANNIEDFNFGISTAKQFTISFWAKASSSYNFSLSLANTSFGATRTYVIPFNVTTTWQKYSYTITADTTGTWGTGENLGLSVRFVLGGAGTTSTFNQWKGDNMYVGGSTQFQTLAQNSFFDLTGVQVEAGAVATPFERRPFGMELALCQRYFEKSYELEDKPGTDVNGLTPAKRGGLLYSVHSDGVSDSTCQIFYKVTKRKSNNTLTFYTTAGSINQVFRSYSGGSQGITPGVSYNSANSVVVFADESIVPAWTNTVVEFCFTCDAEL